MAYSLRFPVGVITLIAFLALLSALYISVPMVQVASTPLDDTVAEQIVGAASQRTKVLSKVYAVAMGITVVAAVIPSPAQPIAWAILGSSAWGVAAGAVTTIGAACVGWGPCG